MIVALDIETTGLSKKDCGITQLSMIKVDETKNFKVVDTFDTYVKPRPDALWQPGAMTCSGITPETVENAPSMSDIAQDVVTFIGDCDILTYNGNSFDLPFLKDELQRVGVELALLGRTVYDSYFIESQLNPRHLGDIYKKYTGETMEEAGLNAHNSFSDVQATIEVFKHQGDIEMLKEMCKDNTCGGTLTTIDGVRYFNMGKYKSLSVAEVIEKDPQWVAWLVKTKKDRDLFTIIKEEYEKTKVSSASKQ